MPNYKSNGGTWVLEAQPETKTDAKEVKSTEVTFKQEKKKTTKKKGR